MMDKNFDRGLLKDEFCFYGKHAKMVQQLKEPVSTEIPISFFHSSVEVLIAAAQIGILEGKRGKVDKSTPDTAKILADQMNTNSYQISRNFRLMMLLHEKEVINIQERLERAFLSDNKIEKRKSLEEIFFSYVLGGVEIIYNGIYGNETSMSDADTVIRNAYEFIEKVVRYEKQKLSTDDIIRKLGADD